MRHTMNTLTSTGKTFLPFTVFIALILLFVVTACCVTPGASQKKPSISGSWERMTEHAGWSARTGQSAVVLPDGDILLMGGYYRKDNSGLYLNDIWRSSDNGSTWKGITGNTNWSPRYGHTSVVLPDGSIVLMGGTSWNIYLNDTWRSTDNGTTWTLMNGSSGWSPRMSHISVAMPDGGIVLMGSYPNDTWRSTDKGATWTEMNASCGWDTRIWHTAVAAKDGSIVLMAGTGGNNTDRNDVWRSADSGATWTELTPHAEWSARDKPACVVMQDDSLVLMGGCAGNHMNDMWRSTDHGATWTKLIPDSGWSKRFLHISLVLPDGSIVLMGGFGFQGDTNDVWRFIPVNSSQPNPLKKDTIPVVSGGVTDYRATRELALSNAKFRKSWTLVNADTAWGKRIGQSSVALPDGSIVLMGGVSGDERNSPAHNDTWRSTDYGKSWKLMNASSGWAARSGHTGASLPDGSVVLMGGAGNGGLFNDTWRSTDYGKSWTLMNASSGWESRTMHTSVVLPDGDIVLIGGWDGLNLKADTWRSTDRGASWSQINTNSGWPKRFMHQSVVTRDGKIILIGGYDFSVRYFNDVWQSADRGITWTQVIENADWPGRIWHNTVVMPDGSIVLFGGELDNGTLVNDLWRSADDGETWIKINASAEWQPRIYHTSVVLPDGSIVLMGGQNWNDVWRFQPAN